MKKIEDKYTMLTNKELSDVKCGFGLMFWTATGLGVLAGVQIVSNIVKRW